MLLATLPRLRCPNCLDGNPGTLSLGRIRRKKGPDVLSGTLACGGCGSGYPILNGVAVLVSDVPAYLRLHAKGISSLVADEDIPDEHRDAYLCARAELAPEAMEEDLESERVNALYFLTHYVRAAGSAKKPWWRPREGFSPEIDRLVRIAWDKGPFPVIAAWTKKDRAQSVIELGCGVGGLARVLDGKVGSYLGVDSAFVSIALARHLNLGGPYALSVKIPQDLYQGPLTGRVAPPKRLRGGKVDFVVGEIENPPAPAGCFDVCVALNTIDVIDDPASLPEIQLRLLKNKGVAVVSSPYLWSEPVVAQLRDSLPRNLRTSSAAVEHLYEQAGFRVFRKKEHVPWLFLEHFRKIGLYSVHLFAARTEPSLKFPRTK